MGIIIRPILSNHRPTLQANLPRKTNIVARALLLVQNIATRSARVTALCWGLAIWMREWTLIWRQIWHQVALCVRRQFIFRTGKIRAKRDMPTSWKKRGTTTDARKPFLASRTPTTIDPTILMASPLLQ